MAASASEQESEETVPEQLESDQTEDLQAGIPEQYRVKINVPADWKDPLPSSDPDLVSLLSGPGKIVDEKKAAGDPLDLPGAVDLFKIAELEEHFDMIVIIDDEGSPAMYESETMRRELNDGEVYISLIDWCDPPKKGWSHGTAGRGAHAGICAAGLREICGKA